MHTRNWAVAVGMLSLSVSVFSYPIIGKERGFYGKIELGYTKENWKYRNGYRLTIDRDLFTQNYQLGFSGFSLSPRLFSFDIRGDFKIDKSTYKSEGTKTTTTLKGFGYFVNLRFFKGTLLPIHLFASRTYMPTRIIAGTFQQDVDTEIDSRGVSVTLNRRNFNITLSHTESDVDSLIQGVDYHNETKQRLASFNYTAQGGRFSTSYTEIDTKTFSPFYTYIDKSKRFGADLGLSRKTWNLSARASYYETLIGQYELYTENLSFSYFPNQRFNMGLFANFNQYRGQVDTDYYALSENVNFRITDNWLLNQNASFFALEETRSASFGSGLSYNKAVTETLNLGFSGSGSYSKWWDTEERNYYSYSLSGTMRKEIKFLRSSFSLSVSQSELFKDGEKASTTFNAFERLGIRLSRTLNFNHSVTYTESESKEYDYKYEMVRSGNFISWQGRVFRRIVLNCRMGIDYWKIMDTETESVKPYTDISGNFFVTRRLFIAFSMNVFRDTLYDNDYTVRGTLRATYNFRKVSIVWDNGYNKEVFRNDFSYERSRYYTSLRITRNF